MKRIILISLVLSLVFILGAAVRETPDGVEFTFSAPNAGSVAVAGDFNSWNPNADLMTLNDGGMWAITLNLPTGSYAYKFVIDGNWTADSDNDKTVDDGYGGSNSLVEVTGDTNGVVSTKKAVKKDIPSGINPKVFFDGRYYTLYEMVNTDDMSRYSLEKPYHDLNLGIKVKLNNNTEGYTLLNANNTREGVDMWKTHLNFRRTWMKLDAEYVNLLAFDDYGMIKFDDHLGIIGSEGYKNYGFGWDYRGIMFSTDHYRLNLDKFIPLSFDLTGLAADRQGNDERDVIAARMKLGYKFKMFMCERELSLGGSYYNSRINNQDTNPINSDPIYIVDSNPAWEIDALMASSLQGAGWQDPMKIYVGYEHLQFENLKEYKDYGEENYDYITEEDFVWQEGNKDFLFFKVAFPAALNLYLGYTANSIELHYEDYIDSLAVLPSTEIDDSDFSRSKWDFKADFELDDYYLSGGFSRWETEYPDSVASWYDYYNFMERTDGNGKWYQDYNELSFAKYTLLGYETGMLWNLMAKAGWKDFSGSYEVNIAQRDFNYKPELIENFFRLSWDIDSKWILSHDLRVPVYNSEFLGIKTDFAEDEDVFAAGYTELCFKLADNIHLALGYGVNPRMIDSISDEFCYDGRREYLEEEGGLNDYLQNTYNGFGEQLRKAESSLEDDNRISIEAVLQF